MFQIMFANCRMRTTILLLCVLFSTFMLIASLHAATTHFASKGGDNTHALQDVLNKMAAGDTLIVDGDVHVSTVLLQNRSNLTIEIAGSLASTLTTTQPKSGPSFSPSKNPVLAIAGGKNITMKSIGNGYLRNGYGEGIAASGVDGLDLSVNIDGSGVGNWDAIYINGARHVAISDCYLKNGSQLHDVLRPGDERVTSYNGSGIRTYGVTGLVIRHVSVSRMSYDGIYLGSGTDPSNPYKNTQILSNLIFDNQGSGIQANFNKPGGIPLTDMTISGNSIWDNTADGIDMNNTGKSAYPMNILVNGNRLYRNGWWNGQRTADGSGIATVINLSDVTLTNNIAIDPQRVGIFAENSSNITASDNLVIKSANSSSYIADVEQGTNIVLRNNDLYVAQGEGKIISLRANVSGGDTVSWSNDYVDGGYIEFPNFHEHAAPRMRLSSAPGLHISETPALKPNFYRFDDGNRTDFVIAYSSSPLRIVAWSPGPQHEVAVNLASGGFRGISVSGVSISGTPLSPAPTISGNRLRLVVSSTPTFLDIR
jgi:parallel beta-helix repeat protein